VPGHSPAPSGVGLHARKHVPVETVTVLFTDLVGSTSLSSTVGPALAEELRREHFALLREAIEEAGGEEVKNLGDGLMVTFASASSALACGVGMQQRIERRNRDSDHQLSIRVAVANGEADRAEDDWFGPPVIEAARLCARAQGDQILVGELARMMVGARGEHYLTSVGALELKGLPEPVEAFEVSWEPLADAVQRPPLPGRLRGVPPVSYVGRVAERERLATLWEAASGGLRQAALISGEPGIGKSRLATHTALELHGDGATVLYGHCDEELGAPYGAWIQALSHYVEHAPESTLDLHLERQGGELGRLVPALRRRRSDLAAPTTSDPETERYLLFSAVTGLLEQASAERPMVLVMDDLHWADKPTLALLKHVLLESAGFHLLLLGTYRESDLSRDHPLTGILADLRGVPGVERLPLQGLDLDDVVSIMEAAAGHEMEEAGRALAEEIAAETGGNPFFVAEILRHLLESGALGQREDGRWELRRELSDLGLPQSVREVIGRRVERLGEKAHGLLRLAAVIGRDFEVELLVRLAREGEDEVLEELEGAVQASVLVERSQPGVFSFGHALINHTLYEEIGATRRAGLHQRVAEALEEICGSDPGPRVVELARHWSAATAPLDRGKAVAYSLRAGERALTELAPDEAVRWFSHALELLDKVPEPDPGERCEALIELGEAQRQAGEPAFRETLLGASWIAEGLGDSDRMARAALANNRGYASVFGEVDSERIAVLERAVELDGRTNPARCARLLSLEAMELQFHPDHERRRALAEEALALAREAADEPTLALVLRDYFQALWCADTLERRGEVTVELERLAARLDDPMVEIAAVITGFHVACEAGRLGDAQEALERWLVLTERLGQPGQRWHALYHAACLALLRGDLERADALAEEASGVGNVAGEPDAVMIYAAQIAVVRTQQGRGGEIVGLIEQAAEDNPGISGFWAGLASLLPELGRHAEAAEIVRRGAADRFVSVPRDQVFATTLALYAQAVTVARVPDGAELLYELLVPWRDQMVWNGASAYGSVELYLGGLAATLGRHEVADAHFAAATAVHEREGVRLWEAHNQVFCARSLLDRGRSQEAREHAERVAALAAENGYGAVGARAAAVLEAAAQVQK
jgi:class 3 adenylate cyclase/tetratricopeptide (TPR) repeat protein